MWKCSSLWPPGVTWALLGPIKSPKDNLTGASLVCVAISRLLPLLVIFPIPVWLYSATPPAGGLQSWAPKSHCARNPCANMRSKPRCAHHCCCSKSQIEDAGLCDTLICPSLFCSAKPVHGYARAHTSVRYILVTTSVGHIRGDGKIQCEVAFEGVLH